MEIEDIKKIIESLLFVSDKPLLNREIKAVIKDDLPENIKFEDIMQQLQQEYIQMNRSFELKFVADGWTFATKPEYSVWIKKLLKEKTILKLSPSAMEVLAIIAYKQPITRAEIDTVRGVDSGGVIDTLTDRKFIKIVGRKETLGRPLLYGTTQEFLRHFGLSHLSELPVIDVAKEDVLPEQKEDIQELPFDNQVDDQNNDKDKNISVESQSQEQIEVENNLSENEPVVEEQSEIQENTLEIKEYNVEEKEEVNGVENKEIESESIVENNIDEQDTIKQDYIENSNENFIEINKITEDIVVELKENNADIEQEIVVEENIENTDTEIKE